MAPAQPPAGPGPHSGTTRLIAVRAMRDQAPVGLTGRAMTVRVVPTWAALSISARPASEMSGSS